MKYVVIDIETTGGNAKTGKIIEIAAFLLENNEIVDEFISLINPECNIPPFITGMTGINSEMLTDAPRFFEIAKELINITENAVFVAHNVSFDYNFIATEYAHLGYHFEREKICTLQQSRKIFPGLPSYSLGKLCKSLNIPLVDRHRAAGDARATTILFKKILEHGIVEEDAPAKLQLKLNPKLLEKRFNEIPRTMGVYYFFNETDDIIYIGKSKNIRKRCLSHFRNKKSKREEKIQSYTTRIEYEETDSELIALLKESSEIEETKPFLNWTGQRNIARFGIFKEEKLTSYIKLYISGINSRNKTLPIHSFPDKDSALRTLERIISKYKLCKKHCGLSKSDGPCINYKIKLCKGACIGVESIEDYNIRVNIALSELCMQHESFLILDGSSARGIPFILIEKGIYKGFGYIDSEQPVESINDCIPYITSNTNEDKKAIGIIQSYRQKNKIRVLFFKKEEIL